MLLLYSFFSFCIGVICHFLSDICHCLNDKCHSDALLGQITSCKARISEQAAHKAACKPSFVPFVLIPAVHCKTKLRAFYRARLMYPEIKFIAFIRLFIQQMLYIITVIYIMSEFKLALISADIYCYQ